MTMMFHMVEGLPELRDGFRFRGGHPALDVTATVSGRLKGLPRDQWQETGDVARWFVAAGLATACPEGRTEDLAEARTLREAIYKLVSAGIEDTDLDPALIGQLNSFAARPSAVPVMSVGGHIDWQGTLSQFLSLLAREAVLLLGSEAVDRLRRCEGGGCAVLFLDTSRAGDRRWCSMSACGNRAKVAEFRRRKREEAKSRAK